MQENFHLTRLYLTIAGPLWQLFRPLRKWRFLQNFPASHTALSPNPILLSLRKPAGQEFLRKSASLLFGASPLRPAFLPLRAVFSPQKTAAKEQKREKPAGFSLQAVEKVQGLFRQPAKMPLLSRRCAAEKSSLRSLNALPSKAFRAFDPTRGGLPPPRAPPPTLRRIRLNRGFSTSWREKPAGFSLQAVEKVQGLFRQPAKMPLLSRRCAAGKSSLRSLNALPCKAFRAFDPTRGGLPPPRAPPPTLGRIRLNRGFSTSWREKPAGFSLEKAMPAVLRPTGRSAFMRMEIWYRVPCWRA